MHASSLEENSGEDEDDKEGEMEMEEGEMELLEMENGKAMMFGHCKTVKSEGKRFEASLSVNMP